MDAGLGGSSLVWRSVQTELGQFSRAYAYDRAGYGWSGAGPMPRSCEQVVREFRALLKGSGLEPPYILVGHSLGGLHMRMFAGQYPNEVAGLVLVESAHEAQEERVRSQFPGANPFHMPAMVKVLLYSARFGLPRLMMTYVSPQKGTNTEAHALEAAMSSHTGTFDAMRSEFAAMPKSLAEMRAMPRSLGDMPLVVVSRGKRGRSPMPGVPDVESSEQIWNDVQEELTKISSRSKRMVAEKSGHDVMIDEPKIVGEAVRSVVLGVSHDAAWKGAGTLSPFVFVMIDSQTEAVYGSLPFNRALVAKAIDRLTSAKAKGIVIKFFHDLPSTEKNDHLLEQSICAARVALQASLNDAEGTTNGLEARFQIGAVPRPGFPSLFVGDKALIPLQRFRHCARAVGFVDSTASEIPLVEIYQGKMAKSLQLVALEMASDQTAEIAPSGFVRLGTTQLDLMHHIEFPKTNSLTYIPFHELMSDADKTWQAKVRQSVVILGYDGKNIHSIETPIGPLGAHRFFVCGLVSLLNAFEKENRLR